MNTVGRCHRHCALVPPQLEAVLQERDTTGSGIVGVSTPGDNVVLATQWGRPQVLDVGKDKDVVAIATLLIRVIDTMKELVCCSKMSAEQRRQARLEGG